MIFLDRDGVLADFNPHAEAFFGLPPRAAKRALGEDEYWRRLREHAGFYRSMPLMADARALYQGVRHLQPTILTGWTFSISFGSCRHAPGPGLRDREGRGRSSGAIIGCSDL
jgi:PAS domain-containing protein